MSMNRRDAHPSGIFRNGKALMDCSHFCLPGVPDFWNMLMLAQVPQWMAETSEEVMEGDEERRSDRR